MRLSLCCAPKFTVAMQKCVWFELNAEHKEDWPVRVFVYDYKRKIVVSHGIGTNISNVICW